MIMVNQITPLIKYEKLKMENHFFEMLTATVSHDMRTPLNAIIGLSCSILDLIKDSSSRKFLGIIQNSAKILLFLVNDLLDFFQMRHGKFRLVPQLIDFRKMIDELIEVFKITAQGREIVLSAEISENVPRELFLDSNRIQ